MSRDLFSEPRFSYSRLPISPIDFFFVSRKKKTLNIVVVVLLLLLLLRQLKYVTTKDSASNLPKQVFFRWMFQKRLSIIKNKFSNCEFCSAFWFQKMSHFLLLKYLLVSVAAEWTIKLPIFSNLSTSPSNGWCHTVQRCVDNTQFAVHFGSTYIGWPNQGNHFQISLQCGKSFPVIYG